MISINKDNCSGCAACANACPKGCIIMRPDQEGFVYPEVDTKKCISCGVCQRVCPINTLHQTSNTSNHEPVCYAAYNKNEQVRLSSSSGGIFTLLAEYALERNGVVFGAALTEQNRIRHICIEKKTELPKLRGSKYVQSEIGNTYVLAEEYLRTGRLVLFSGTPCQIGGLKSYLRKEYDNLITQDIICHGCPSPLVWHKYLEFREKQSGDVVQSVSFRDKRKGWKRFSLRLGFEKGREYTRTLFSDLFLQGFLKDFCLRPSCYQCSFRGIVRESDITLADYWGIGSVHPEMDDDKGTSLVVANTDAGRRVLDVILLSCVYCRSDGYKAFKHNPAIIYSPNRPKERDTYIQDVVGLGFSRVKTKYFRTTHKDAFYLARRVLSKVKRILIAVVRKRYNKGLQDKSKE